MLTPFSHPAYRTQLLALPPALPTNTELLLEKLADHKTVVISVTSGGHHTGVTTIAALIVKALAEQAFTNVTVACQDGDLDVRMDDVIAGIPNALKEKPIVVMDLGINSQLAIAYR